MNLKLKSINELLDIALNTTSINEMLFLQDHPSMNIRRALAKNMQIDEGILNNLAFDPVQNVSYAASLNPKNKNNRNFEKLRPCVICEKEERTMNCIDCEEVKEHSF